MIASHRGRLSVTGGDAAHALRPHRARFRGTLVTALIRANREFNVESALLFGSGKSTHLNILDFYDDEGDAMVLRLATETDGFGSRLSGRYLREKCRYLLGQESNKRLILDWAGVPLISSSFADEALGKLFVTLGPLQFGARVKHRAIEPINIGLINKAILQRAAQEVARARVTSPAALRQPRYQQRRITNTH